MGGSQGPGVPEAKGCFGGWALEGFSEGVKRSYPSLNLLQARGWGPMQL